MKYVVIIDGEGESAGILTGTPEEISKIVDDYNTKEREFKDSYTYEYNKYIQKRNISAFDLGITKTVDYEKYTDKVNTDFKKVVKDLKDKFPLHAYTFVLKESVEVSEFQKIENKVKFLNRLNG